MYCEKRTKKVGIEMCKENIFVACRRLWELKNLLFFLVEKDGIRVKHQNKWKIERVRENTST